MKNKTFYAVLLLTMYLLTMAFSNSMPVASTTTTATKTTDQLADIISSGVLKVGADTTYAPFESINTTTGKAQGFDVDLANYIAYQLTPNHNVTAQIITSQWDPIIPNLQAGSFNIILSAMTITAARAQQVNFTRWYYQSFQAILVPNANPLNITSPTDLNKTGVDIGVQSGTTEAIYAQNLTQATIHTYDKIGNAITAMGAGTVDCVLGDYAVVALNAAEGVNKVVATYSPEYFGIAVKIGETNLLNKINTILDGLLGTNLELPEYNTNYTSMYVKWFDIQPPTTHQTSLTLPTSSVTDTTPTSKSTTTSPGFELVAIALIAPIVVIRKVKRQNRK